MRKRVLPLVKGQQLSRFLAFGLSLHHIPVFLIHIPPCGWILTGKQSTHGSRELTASPTNIDKITCKVSILQEQNIVPILMYNFKTVLKLIDKNYVHLRFKETKIKTKPPSSLLPPINSLISVLHSCDDASVMTYGIPARFSVYYFRYRKQ